MEATQVPMNRWMDKEDVGDIYIYVCVCVCVCVLCLVAQLCLTLCNPMDCSLPGIYIYICIYGIYTYYIGTQPEKKNEIMPFATIWMDLEGILLREISQRKTNTVWYHGYVESEK